MSTASTTPERWNRRDEEVLDDLFEGVDCWYRPKEELRFIEYTNSKPTAIVDYCIGNSPEQSAWPAHATVVWERSACDCKTIVSGQIKYQTEAEYLGALYQRAGIVDGHIPPKPLSVGSDTSWLSERHRQYDRKACAFDVDAWSCTGSGLVVWELKYQEVKVQPFQLKVYQNASRALCNAPVVLVRYEQVVLLKFCKSFPDHG